MQSDMAKSYQHQDVEARLYEKWEKAGYFRAAPNPEKPPFCIVMPPPNITGQLHMGHALDNTLQDILTRYKRMQGFEALWLPGTDHASIATELKIVEQLQSEGTSKTELGREEFLRRAWKWRDEYGGRIVRQLRRLGSSCDWERERFTMDEGCSSAVLDAFIQLYEKGLIYRGDRIVNWCTECKTTISDIEVEYEEQKSFLWHVRYDAPDGSYSVTVATTRPETILGDTAIAVNPKDERYAAIVGKTVIVPGVGREIPIVADAYVERDFGTGAVKITPAHDPNDFEVGARCALPSICVFNDDGTVNENGGKYRGMDRFACREAFVEELERLGALVKTEPYDHNVGICYRCHSTVEPLIKKQWFVKMRPLAEPAIDAVRSKDVRFIPERFDKTYLNWMENIHDWCISRQLWWGHRIPAYYCQACGEMVIRKDPPDACRCGGRFRQDEDVLDTWFSSGLWPFSTLGYPEKTEDLAYFYPTSTLVTGYDIIFFWVARMIVFGLDVMGKSPFGNVFVHGIIRDSQGRKMSKSLGNGIDPLEVIEKHGADSLRFSLVTGNSPGNDMRFYWEKVESCGNFCNKIYNASRFVRMNLTAGGDGGLDRARLDLSDRWLLTRLEETRREVTANMEAYDLGMAAQKLYDFIWSEFCDWFIELKKPCLYEGDAAVKASAQAVLLYALRKILQLLHPFMPFITEEIYQHLPGAEETIMLSAWPAETAENLFPEETRTMQGIMEMIRAVRNVRAEMNVPPGRRAKLMIVAPRERHEAIRGAEVFLVRLAAADTVELHDNKSAIPPAAVCAVCPMAEVYMPLEELVDLQKERERVQKERARLDGEIARAQGKLGNAAFIAKAPAKVVEEEREKLALAKEMLEKLEAYASAL